MEYTPASLIESPLNILGSGFESLPFAQYPYVSAKSVCVIAQRRITNSS